MPSALRKNKLLLGGLAFLLVHLACTSAGVERSRPGTEVRKAGEGAERADREARHEGKQDPELARALGAALDRGGPWRDLEIEAECASDEGFLTTKVFGSGVGIWKRKVQFQLSEPEVRRLLGRLQRAGFLSWPESFGEAGEEFGERPDQALPPRVVCDVSLALGGRRKQVVQFAEGEQSPELHRLSLAILDASRQAAARNGVTAASLGEGLEQVAGGELAPEVLSLELHRKGTEGCLMWLQGGAVTARRYTPGKGYDEPVRLELRPGEIRNLAARLAEDDAAKLPQNLYATDYTDFTLTVLDHEEDVQARQFAGMTPETHGERQQAWDRISDRVRTLCDRALREGTPTPIE